jgi:hypothetical protein
MERIHSRHCIHAVARACETIREVFGQWLATTLGQTRAAGARNASEPDTIKQRVFPACR